MIQRDIDNIDKTLRKADVLEVLTCLTLAEKRADIASKQKKFDADLTLRQQKVQLLKDTRWMHTN